MAPIGACDKPQTIFWTATASVKSAAVSARSRVTGVRNRPKLWRIPMPRLSSTAAPIRISRVWRRLPGGSIIHGIPESAPFAQNIWQNIWVRSGGNRRTPIIAPESAPFAQNIWQNIWVRSGGNRRTPIIAVCPRGSSLGELKTVTGTTPRLAYVYLGVMVATWAGNWPLMRLALAHTEPMVFVSLRMAGSIAILAPIFAVLHRPLLPDPGERLALFWVSLFQVTGFLVFSIIGLAIVAPGRAIVLAYTMPLWAILLGLGWSREVLSPSKLAGAAIGFAGLVVFMNPALVNWTNRREVTGNLLLLLAAMCWAVGSCLYGRRA